METASMARPGYRVLYLLAALAVAGGTLAQPAFGQGDPGTWSSLPSMPTPRRLLAAAVEGDAIYTFGGCGSPCFAPPLHTSTLEETRLEVYNYKDRVWTIRKPIPAILFGAAAATVGKKIYLFGGYVTGGDTYEYDPDPQADSWKRKAAMPTPRHGLAAVAWDSKIYVLGGSNGSAATGALEVYDPSSDSWSQEEPAMPTPRAFFAAAAVNGKIYAIGGSPDGSGDGNGNASGRTDIVEVYDTAAKSWSRAASLPVALQVSAAVAMNGKIYVFGGFIPGSGVQGSTFEFDPEGADKKWVRKAAMLDPRDQAPAVVLKENGLEVAHVVGGSVDCHCQARGTHDRYKPPPPPVVQPMADLAIQKTSDPSGAVCPGQTVEYTIKVTNLGPDAVSGARVTDDFGRLRKSGLRNIRWCRGEGCTPSRSDDLRDTVTLEKDKSVIYEVMGTVAPTATGTLVNTASVDVDPSDSVIDPKPGNNTSPEALNPIARECPVSIISITKTADRSMAAPGETIQYTIKVTNQGPVAVSGATVKDNLGESGLQNVRWCRGSGCRPESHGSLLDTVRLPANRPVTYTVTGTVPCDCGRTQIDNKACVTAPGHPDEVCSPTTVLIVPTPGGDLDLTITGPSDLKDCGPQPYTFTVTNHGPGIACGAMLQMEPPAGSEIVSISGPCTGLLCSLGDISPGSPPIEVKAAFSLPAGLVCPATLRTNASVTACDSATSTAETKVPCVLSVNKTDRLETAIPGDSILYTIGVKNLGCAAVSQARVEDDFPAEILPVEWCRGADCTPSLPSPLRDTLDLPPGGMETYRASGIVLPQFTGKLINTVCVSPPGDGRFCATDETMIVPLPPPMDVIASCDALSGDSFEGGIITKTFVIFNQGSAVQGDNPGPEFEDVLPAGLTLVSASADSGTITTVPVDNTVRWNGSIQPKGTPGDTVTVQIMAMIDLGTMGMKICNGATTFFDSDGDGDNESSRPAAPPCCLQVQPAAMIPSLSGPGLAVLILLLCALALARLRRRPYP